MRGAFGDLLPTLLSGIPVLVIPALEWLPFIPESWRPWSISVSLVLAAIGIIWLRLRGHKLRELLEENDALRTGILETEPEYFLRQIAGPLFREGAWRVSILRKTYSPENPHQERLDRLAAASSDIDQTDRGPDRIQIVPGTHFSHVFSSNLADAKFRRAEESGSFPGDPLAEEWTTWRDEIFGQRDELSDRSSLRPRKFAWFAAQDAKTSKVLVVLAESTGEEGIAVDLLNHPLTPSWLFFVAHLAELRSGVE